MDIKKLTREICLKPVRNKKNDQYNFSLKKKQIPKEMRMKLPTLKSIKVKMEDFEF